MRFLLLPLLIISVATYGQRDTIFRYSERYVLDFIDDSTLVIDSFRMEKGATLTFVISGDRVLIPYFDSLEISHSFRRLDSALIVILYHKVLTGYDTSWKEIDTVSDMVEVIAPNYEYKGPIICTIRNDFIDIEYPKPQPGGKWYTRTVVFILPPKPPYSD